MNVQAIERASAELPIATVLPEVVCRIGDNHPLVIQAPPGAGKTTGVPPALLRHPNWIDRTSTDSENADQIWIVQPRRLAARMVAFRLADLLGESVGQTSGYHVRLDRREGKSTKLLSMTTGMFLRRMQADPLLERAGVVILDEFHERTLEADLSLALTCRLRESLRESLRLVVMSATLEPKPIVDYLNDHQPDLPAAIGLECPGRAFPVQFQHRGGNAREPLSSRVADGVEEAWSATDGHVLVFLPGVHEIERAASELRRRSFPSPPEIVKLHGGLSSKDQDLATRPSTNRRIVLATNIAETSVTVAGVTAVVDSGLAKQPQWDSRRGWTRLETLPISIAAAQQRAGRAGRTAPGIAYRLWSAAGDRGRADSDPPEVLRGDLSDAVLRLASMGEHEIDRFPWLTPPPAHAVDAAQSLLCQCGALDAAGRITTLGRKMAQLSMPPRLARFALAAARALPLNEVAIAAAILSERDPFSVRSPGGQNNPAARGTPMNLAEKVVRLQKQTRPDGHVDADATRHLRRVAKQFTRSLENLMDGWDENKRDRAPDKNVGAHRKGSDDRHEQFLRRELGQALVAAYPDRVALVRSTDPDAAVMVGGRGVCGVRAVLRAEGVTQMSDPTLVLCLDVEGRQGPAAILREGLLVDPEWLPEKQVDESDEWMFDAETRSIRARRVVRYRGLPLRQTPTTCKPNEQTSELLFRHASEQIDEVTPAGSTNHDFRMLCRRIELVAEDDVRRQVDAAQAVSPADESLVLETLRELCQTRLSFQELQRAPWTDHLLGRLGYEQWQRVETFAPAHLTLPSGNRAKIHYERDKTPWLAARIQEFFGWNQTPSILDGRLPLQLHLLGPNRRPQQITEDLPSFWQNTYPRIRGELKRRYGKHHWPDDPATAIATANGLKPR